MKLKIIIIFFFSISQLNAEINLRYFTEKALKNNLELNAERKNFESVKQSKIISRSEFLPSLTISGEQNSSTTTNRTNQSGSTLTDTNLDSESKTISLEQKIFSGFKGIHTFKKIELETQKAKLEFQRTTNNLGYSRSLF